MANNSLPPARIYRMVTPEHTCPYGVKAKYLLEQRGYKVTDVQLTSRPQIDAFKAEFSVATTPQVFIGEERIGGYDDLRSHFDHYATHQDRPSYQPVMIIFATALILALAINTQMPMGIAMLLSNFIAITMMLLAMQKLRNVEAFSTMFINYDVLAKRWVPYAYLYPYLEFFAGAAMLAGVLHTLSIPIALITGSIGTWSVFKAVYLDKRALTCACAGGDVKVPLGFVSLTENVLMAGMGLWMLQMIYF